MKRVLAALVAAGAMAIAGTVPAMAADNYSPPSQIPTGAQCGTGASSGSFGAFGKEYNFGAGIENLGGAPAGPHGLGANGPITGDNNADVCGNS